jgi:tetratricopeptide (TPR) repeat protein
VVIYLLTTFLSQAQKKFMINVSVFMGLWLSIYIFAFNLSSVNFLKASMSTSCVTTYVCFLLVSFSLSFAFWNDQAKVYKFLPYILFCAILLTKLLIPITIACLVFAGSIFFLKKHKIKNIFSLSFALFSVLPCYWLFKTNFFNSKIFMWKTALFVIEDNFLIGVGFNNYKTVSRAYGLIQDIDISNIDNIFLQVLCENGIFGFVFFILILVTFFYYSIRKIKENRDFYFAIFVASISFLLYNFFNSSAFISSNMLLFFSILAMPVRQVKNIKVRKRKINSHILILLFVPFIFALGRFVYAKEQYNKGIYYLATAKYPVAQELFINSVCKDSLNPETFARLGDIYFYKYQNTKKRIFLELAISLYSRSLNLNNYNSNYCYQLAWLYSFYGKKDHVKKYIDKAILMDPFNFLYYENYNTLISLGVANDV